MIYHVLRDQAVVETIHALRSERVVLKREREPNALGTAPYDPLIDIAYEQIKKGHGREMDRQLIDRVGGMEHVETMRAQVRF